MLRWFNRGLVSPVSKGALIIASEEEGSGDPCEGVFGSILSGCEIPVAYLPAKNHDSNQEQSRIYEDWHNQRILRMYDGEGTWVVLAGPTAVEVWHRAIRHLTDNQWKTSLSDLVDYFRAGKGIQLPVGIHREGESAVSGFFYVSYLPEDIVHSPAVLKRFLPTLIDKLGGRDAGRIPKPSSPGKVFVCAFEDEVNREIDNLFAGALGAGELVPEATEHLSRNISNGGIFRSDLPMICYDIETVVSDKDERRLTFWHPDAELLCMAIGVLKREKGEDGRAALVPHSLTLPAEFCTASVLNRIFSSVSIACAHNRNYDTNGLFALERFNVLNYPIANLCSMGAGYVLNQNPIPEAMGGQGLGLKSLSVWHLGAPKWDSELDDDEKRIKANIIIENRAISVENRKRIKAGQDPLPLRRPFTYKDHDRDKVFSYCGQDVGNGVGLAVVLLQNIASVDAKEKNDGLSLSEYYFNLYSPMLDDLALIERTGICVNKDKLEANRLMYEKEIDRIHSTLEKHPLIKQACEEYQVNFNVKSPAFTSALIQVTGMTKLSKKSGASGNYSCDKVVLSKLRAENVDHAEKTMVQKLWNYVYYERRYRDLISKNIQAIEPYLMPNGRVHPSIKTAKMEESDKGDAGGTKTSRVTTKHPSTNTLIKDKGFLEAFDCPPGMIMVKSDFTSIEPLWHALLGGFEPWIEAFRKKLADPDNPLADLYKVSYAPVIGVDPADVVGKVRDVAKIFLLAMLYDRHYKTLAEILRVSEDESKRMCDNFWAAHPELAVRSNKIKLEFLRGNSIRNIFGQRAFYPLRVGGKGYSDKLLSYIECNFLTKPLYEWAESSILSSMGLLYADIETCRAVGNWEIQSCGWTMTASLIGPLLDYLRTMDGAAELPETIHDAYRNYLMLYPDAGRHGDCAWIIDEMYGFLQNLGNSRLKGLPGTAKLEKRIGMTLEEIPLVTEIQVGYNGGQMKVHKPGGPLWMPTPRGA